MSMLTLRQVPTRPATSRIDWQSPSTIPRLWVIVTFTGFAGYAVAMSLMSTNELHRLWGVFAACSYLLAAMVVLVWKSRGINLALVISLAGALILPLSLMAVHQMRQPEVGVINQSASLLVHHGTPY